MPKKILIIGSGGREHALGWKLSQSKHIDTIYVAPGNAGTQIEANTIHVPMNVTETQALIEFALDHSVDCILVGPEVALEAGIADHANQAGIPCIGPTRAVAQLETSKSYAKKVMQKLQIPTADYAVFTELQSAQNYLKTQSFPVVIKASGLAAGKGVFIVQTNEEGQDVLTRMLEHRIFGQAGKEVVIERFLEGEELSFIAISDGKTALPLATSQDHKRRFDFDTGPNTGGMGAYSPVPLPAGVEDEICRTICQPIVTHFKNQGTPYIGFLYAGLMRLSSGDIAVLEFNCRLGDPETQPLLMRLQTDPAELLDAVIHKKLDKLDLSWDSRYALSVVMVAPGYPGNTETGHCIAGLDCDVGSDAKIFHAGTLSKNNQVITAGGRVLSVTALGDTLQDAQHKAYSICQHITWPGSDYRTDIGSTGMTAEYNELYT